MIRFWRRREKPTFLPPGAFQVYTHGAWSMFLSYGYVCAHTEARSQIQVWFLRCWPPCVSEAGSFTDLEIINYSQTPWSASPQRPPYLCLPLRLGFASTHYCVQSFFFLMWVLGIELSSSHLRGNHFTYWSISPGPYGSFEIFIYLVSFRCLCTCACLSLGTQYVFGSPQRPDIGSPYIWSYRF